MGCQPGCRGQPLQRQGQTEGTWRGLGLWYPAAMAPRTDGQSVSADTGRRRSTVSGSIVQVVEAAGAAAAMPGQPSSAQQRAAASPARNNDANGSVGRHQEALQIRTTETSSSDGARGSHGSRGRVRRGAPRGAARSGRVMARASPGTKLLAGFLKKHMKIKHL